jgi:hypothetical protein
MAKPKAIFTFEPRSVLCQLTLKVFGVFFVASLLEPGRHMPDTPSTISDGEAEVRSLCSAGFSGHFIRCAFRNRAYVEAI